MTFIRALLAALAVHIATHPRDVRAASTFVDPAKVLRVSIDGEEAGFDPQAAGERMRINERMSRIVGVYHPGGLRVYAIRTSLARPRVKGYCRNPHFLQAWRVVDVDAAAQKAFAAR